MDDFAEKYPDLVVTFLKSECEAIDFWINNPDKTAEIIAKELSLPIEDATRMMKGTEMVPCDKQLTAEYLGVPRVKANLRIRWLKPDPFSSSKSACRNFCRNPISKRF